LIAIIFSLSSTVPLFHSEAVVGSEARLPCNLTSPIAGDRVSLVIWYKEGQSTPIYSYDVRHTEELEKGSHHEGTGSLNGRSHFNTTSLPSFVITSVKGQDNGLYRCRVDFIKSPTRNIKIQLSVIGEIIEKMISISDRIVISSFSSLSSASQFHPKASPSSTRKEFKHLTSSSGPSTRAPR
jgi:Immunoglobulin V-set domain